MDFVSNTEAQRKEMLAAIGVKDVEALFASIPKSLLLPPPLQDDGLSEYEGLRMMEALAGKNTFPNFDNYMGAGAYEHHIPALVGMICNKSEFLTAYTPYQAEASQGMLQAIFEFQSAICALTGMDVANASVYDGASACAEGLLMALRHHKERRKIIVHEGVNPLYRDVVRQYVVRHDVAIVVLSSQEAILEQLDEQTAAVLVQSPNFFGLLEDIEAISARAKSAGALMVLCSNPLAYGLFKSARELGADIAVGDCQPFGIPLQFGGPYLGYIACTKEWVRQMPGRLVGETIDTQGRRGFVLTLQAREQHIRREKATSNICTNQALAALASLVAMLWYGPQGIRELALANFQRTAYLRERILAVKEIEAVSNGTHFNEFAIRINRPLDKVLDYFRAQGIQPGVPLSPFYPELQNTLLIAVTETKSLEQLDRYVRIAEEALA